MSGWHVLYGKEQRGPLSKEEFASFVRGKDASRLYVWREGLEAWVLAETIPSLVAHMRVKKKPRKLKWAVCGALAGLGIMATRAVFGSIPSSNPAYLTGYVGGSIFTTAVLGLIAGTIADAVWGVRYEKKVERDFRFNNLIAKHWRGELPLWVSYWAFGFLGNLAIASFPHLIENVFKSNSGYYPPAIFASVYLTWTAVGLIVTWQFVGIWRSARKYTEARHRVGKRTIWGGLAQVAVTLGVFSSAGTFLSQGVPQLKEVFEIAFQDDPTIPPYSIRVMRAGTEAEIVGGFKYGLTDDFQKILKASRDIKVIHLDSIGGRLGEGEKLYKLIREKGLDTYVSSKCMSACTLAFAGGRQRYLNKRAMLGFHRGSFPGAKEGDFDEAQRRVFLASGFDAGFIRTALSTPHKDMWKPPADVLLKSGVVTSVVDGDKFAISGFGDFSREDLGTKLAAAVSSFKAFRNRFPKEYDAAVDEFYKALVKGRTEAEAIQSMRDRLLPVITSLIPLSDDDVLADFTTLLVAQYRALNDVDPSYCYGYASGKSNRNFTSLLPRQLVDLESKIQERVISTARKRDKAEPPQLDALTAKLRTALVARGMSMKQLEIMDTDNIPASRYKEYCQTVITFFEEVARMPAREAAMFMRSVLGK